MLSADSSLGNTADTTITQWGSCVVHNLRRSSMAERVDKHKLPRGKEVDGYIQVAVLFSVEFYEVIS